MRTIQPKATACVCSTGAIAYTAPDGYLATAPVRYRCVEHAPDGRKADKLKDAIAYRAAWLARVAILPAPLSH